LRSKKSRPEQDVPDIALRPSLVRVIRLFRPYRLRLAALMFTVIAESGATIAGPLLLRGILDHALPERSMGLLTLLVLGMGGSAVIAAVLTTFSNWLSSYIGQQIMHDVRVAVYSHMQKMSFAFFTHSETGEVQSSIANDIGSISGIVTGTAASAVQSITLIVAVGVSIFVLDWQLALVATAVIPLFLLFTLRLGRKRRQIITIRQSRFRSLTALVEESMSVAGALLIKTMARQRDMNQKFSEESRRISDLAVQSAMVGKWRTASRRMSMTVIPATCYWIAGWEFTHGGQIVSIGTVVAFTSMLNRVIGPANDLQGLGLDVSTSMAIFVRIFGLLDQPIGIAEAPDARPLAVTDGSVCLEDVYFAYENNGDQWTLSGVNIRIPGGRRTALVGHTGAGKTTIAYLIARLYDPGRGNVRIDGTDLRDVQFESLAAAVGFVSQETYLFHSTIAENLRLAKPDATDEELEAAARAARIHDLIASLPDGYQTRVGARGYRFSGGERQRIAIARLLLRDTRIVVLDEATSALDNETERAVQDAIDTLTKGRTTITIAHRLSTVVNADQILVVDHGRIVERGTHAELMMKQGAYAALVRAPVALTSTAAPAEVTLSAPPGASRLSGGMPHAEIASLKPEGNGAR
jgi:ATP-binding cassette subfamily B protein